MRSINKERLDCMRGHYRSPIKRLVELELELYSSVNVLTDMAEFKS